MPCKKKICDTHVTRAFFGVHLVRVGWEGLGFEFERSDARGEGEKELFFFLFGFFYFFFVEVSKKIKEVLPGETHGETFRKRNLSSFCFRRINVGINVQVYFEI